MTISLVLGSSAAVCSSSSKSFGLTKAAMTKVRACRCPPDKYCVSTLRRFSKPILSSLKAVLNSSRSFSLTPQLSPRFAPRFLAMAIFSSMVKREAVPILGSWKTRAISFARFRTLVCLIDCPSKRISPWSTCRPPARIFIKVDLPAPFPPMTEMKSPSSTVRSKPLRTWFSLTVPASNVLWISSIFNNVAIYLLLLVAG
ncbi:hypothetical protein SORDD21_01823 [Streptococcus oralis]|uniref:Uncharacterized protein n=1 Tax=Streptococcus oralis TaxID=1303 RepID=A0A139PH23_STROR|nr:hypothetical protein SORDD21_01823 [Streptococcus oralis]